VFNLVYIINGKFYYEIPTQKEEDNYIYSLCLIFLLLIYISVFCYLIIAFIVNIIFGKKDSEIIPHYKLFKETLPKLITDGVKLILLIQDEDKIDEEKKNKENPNYTF
jgi:hypothetical protein